MYEVPYLVFVKFVGNNIKVGRDGKEEGRDEKQNPYSPLLLYQVFFLGGG